MQVDISVRTLVEFILRSGDIDNRIGTFRENAMVEGGRIHRMLQKRAGADYSAEVPLNFTYKGKECDIHVEGRADGIIDNPSGITVDEIKSTYADVMRYKAPYEIHLAQAKFYAYIVSEERNLSSINVRITYCNIETEEVKYFNEEYSYIELKMFVEGVCGEYERWAAFTLKWHDERNTSIKGLPFPFDYRNGQDELVKQVYYTIYHKKKLFLEAPTGVGKTISTMYPAIQAMGQNLSSKIFYLTAKTITRTVAADTADILREKGLRLKSIVLTAKEKICMTGDSECNPDSCPYAKGHFDRVNDAMFTMLNEADSFTRETIIEYSRRFMVCPFEMSLDLSMFCDLIVGDYNYAFDPRAKLKRYFADEKKNDYIFLIDEAHNLVDRAREMFSAAIIKEDLMALKRITEIEIPNLSKKAEKCNKIMLSLKRECEENLVNPPIDDLYLSLTRLYSDIEKIIQDKSKPDKEEQKNTIDGKPVHIVSPELKKQLLEYYFELSSFLTTYELLDENYSVYCSYDDAGDFFVKLFCINPRDNLMACLDNIRSTVLFSATLLPIDYYKLLLAGKEDDYEVYAKSVFNPNRKKLLIADDVTSKYTRRNDDEYLKIAKYIYEIVSQRDGNYMVFFPSYGFMDKVYEAYKNCLSDRLNAECLVQFSGMKEEDKEAFLSRFKGSDDVSFDMIKEMDVEEESESTLIGFCVMGGIFSEGIDLKEDSLIGAIIVGTGLPLVCLERELIKEMFDASGVSGFDYAYRYPGMNKVLQAAGRVIRTESDIGVVALLDERFLQNSYVKMFPREWNDYDRVSVNTASSKVERFWDEWL